MNLPNLLTADELLDQAADLLEERGWARATDRGFTVNQEQEGSTCISISVNWVLTAGPPRAEAFQYIRSTIGLGPTKLLTKWNDDECKDQAEAVGVLRQAAEAARADKEKK